MKALISQQQAAKVLLDKGAILKLIVWPVRAYENQYLAIRFRNLLSWMRHTKDYENGHYICAQYSGPSRIVVEGQFCIDGYKQQHSTRYDLRIVKYDHSSVRESVVRFNATFDTFYHDKDLAIQKVEDMQDKLT